MTRLLADVNVGRLGRWLRTIGYDTEIDSGRVDDAELVRRAALEGRVLLTRDRDIPRRRAVAQGAVLAILLKSDRVADQLRQVIDELGLDRGELLARCIECNLTLAPARPDEVADGVPLHVRRTQTEFSRCQGCGRIYWPGTHRARMLAFLEQL